jgi:pimeloyl-ACP methyl ester carboxylesterase
MGSTLQRTNGVAGSTGKSIWTDNLWELLKSFVAYGDLTYYTTDDGNVKAPRLMGRVAAGPFVEFFPGYDRLLDKLRSLGFREESSSIGKLFPWPYDWRRSMTQLGTDLTAALHAELHASGCERLVIIAHSFGCLVTRQALLSDLGQMGSIASTSTRLVEITPPFAGSPLAVLALYKDPLEGFGLLQYVSKFILGHYDVAARFLYYKLRKGIQRAASSFHSAFELMPAANSYVAFDDGRGDQFTTKDWLRTFGHDYPLMLGLLTRDKLDAASSQLDSLLSRIDRVVLDLPASTPATLSCKRGFLSKELILIGVAERGNGDRVVPTESARRWSDNARILELQDNRLAHNSAPVADQVLSLMEDVTLWR